MLLQIVYVLKETKEVGHTTSANRRRGYNDDTITRSQIQDLRDVNYDILNSGVSSTIRWEQ